MGSTPTISAKEKPVNSRVYGLFFFYAHTPEKGAFFMSSLLKFSPKNKLHKIDAAPDVF